MTSKLTSDKFVVYTCVHMPTLQDVTCPLSYFAHAHSRVHTQHTLHYRNVPSTSRHVAVQILHLLIKE